MPQSTIAYSTPKQRNYLEILFNELEFTRNSRNVFLTDRYKRTIKYLDELTLGEASDAIGYLKNIRAREPEHEHFIQDEYCNCLIPMTDEDSRCIKCKRIRK